MSVMRKPERAIRKIPSGPGPLVAAVLVAQLAAATTAASPFTAGLRTGVVAASDISEASGLAATRTRPGLLWVHNDSGNRARVFAIRTDASLVATYDLVGVHAIDYEDVAVGPGPAPGLSYVYLGDIGDNFANRPSIVIHRFVEPDASELDGKIAAEDVAVLEMRYPDGAHDAEALMSDAATGDLFVITKSVAGKNGVYRAPFPHSERATNTLERVGTIVFPGEGPSELAVTAADISVAGDEILIRSYNLGALWKRAAGESVASALTRAPTPVPVPGPPREQQGEAIAFSSDGSSYFTLGEGIAQPLFRFDRTVTE